VIEAGVEEAERSASSTPIHISQVTFHAPLHPRTLRDGYAFEQHVKTANAIRGREVPQEWYQFPVFYFTNPHSIFGPNDTIPYPAYTSELDYELEIAVVIGKRGRDIRPADAPLHIFGYTIFNDWSARDVQRQEMIVGLGPAKGKDFASSLGPYLVTLEELGERATNRPGVFDMPMIARINGQERSRGNMKDLYWSFGDIIARASQGVELFPGDVIGSGTVGTGSLLELTKRQGPWLQPGDVVELEVEGIGVLRNVIGPRP
jgi:fumarylacetoacetate (FAA) hydrolase